MMPTKPLMFGNGIYFAEAVRRRLWLPCAPPLRRMSVVLSVIIHDRAGQGPQLWHGSVEVRSSSWRVSAAKRRHQRHELRGTKGAYGMVRLTQVRVTSSTLTA